MILIKKIFYTCLLFVLLSTLLWGQTYQKGLFTDSRDGHTYSTVKIGDQVWLAQNLNYATENPPDLILLDIELCKGSGGTIYKNIKKYRKKILLPILLMSKRLPKKELRKETTRLGAEDLISKPFELDELIIKIKKILDEPYPV